MSTLPRDAGIPMLTEVIEEEAMAFVGPPAPEDALQTPAAIDHPPVAATIHVSPASSTMPAASGYALTHGVGIQYGPPAQFAPSYPLPLKPAASSNAMPASRETTPAHVTQPDTPPLPAPMSEDEWQRMERRVRERILGQLLSRTDAMLEERIRSSVAGVLEQAVDGLAATLRASLHKTLEDVVSRAVAQEISRLQSAKK
jgi:hypothetical protein